MRTLIFVLLALIAVTGSAFARSTRDFMDACAADVAACAIEIKSVGNSLQEGPLIDREKLCYPPGMSDEGLVGEVTYWIDEQVPSLEQQDDVKSIGAALIALYACGQVKTIDTQEH